MSSAKAGIERANDGDCCTVQYSSATKEGTGRSCSQGKESSSGRRNDIHLDSGGGAPRKASRAGPDEKETNLKEEQARQGHRAASASRVPGAPTPTKYPLSSVGTSHSETLSRSVCACMRPHLDHNHGDQQGCTETGVQTAPASPSVGGGLVPVRQGR